MFVPQRDFANPGNLLRAENNFHGTPSTCCGTLPWQIDLRDCFDQRAFTCALAPDYGNFGESYDAFRATVAQLFDEFIELLTRERVNSSREIGEVDARGSIAMLQTLRGHLVGETGNDEQGSLNTQKKLDVGLDSE